MKDANRTICFWPQITFGTLLELYNNTNTGIQVMPNNNTYKRVGYMSYMTKSSIDEDIPCQIRLYSSLFVCLESQLRLKRGRVLICLDTERQRVVYRRSRLLHPLVGLLGRDLGQLLAGTT